MARLILKHIEADILGGGRCRFTASLAYKGMIYKGAAIAHEHDTEEKQLNAVANATLVAISKLIPESVRMRLVQTGRVILTNPPLVSKAMFFVVIESMDGSNLEFLSGTCIYSIVNLEIAARAVLKAVNRPLEKYGTAQF